MADSNRLSSSPLSRLRWLALPVAIVFAFVGAVLLRRRGQPEVLVVPVPVPPHPAPMKAVEKPPIAAQDVIPPRVQSPLRWILYLGAACLFVGTLVVLQDGAPELAAVLFALIPIAAVGYISYKSSDRIRRQIATVRTELLEIWRLLKHRVDAVSFIMVGVAFCGAIACAVLLNDSISFSPSFGSALVLFFIGFCALGIPLGLKPTSLLPAQWTGSVAPTDNLRRSFDWRRSSIGLVTTLSGVAMLFLLAQINYNVLDTALLKNVHHVVQLALLVFGILLLVVGVGGRIHLPVMTRRELVLFSGVVLVALLLRCVALGTAIPRFVDEVNFMEAIPRLWVNPGTRILIPFGDITAFTWIYPILQSGISNILGSSMVGLRLISAIFGTLGVAALYFLVRTTFHDKGLALAAALVLATFPAHLHFSRLGLNNIADPMFGTPALAFLVRALQSHRRSDYVLAGAALGLTQYFYEGGRLLFPPLFVVAFVVIWLMSGHRKADLIHGGYALLVAILVAAPVYYTLVGGGSFVTPRFHEQELHVDLWAQLTDSVSTAVRMLRERFLYPLLMYTSVLDLSWFYGGDQALIIVPLIPFFLMGIAYSLWKLRTPAMIIFLGWIFATGIGNGLLVDNLWVPRYVVAFPALAVFIALGIYATVILAWPLVKARRALVVALALMTLLLTTAQTVFYFRDQVPNFNRQLRQEDWNDAFFHMIDLPPGTHVHFIMDEPVWNINIRAFLDYFRLDLDVDTLTPREVTGQYLRKLAAESKGQQVFFVNPAKQALLTRMGTYFTLESPLFEYSDVGTAYQLWMYKAKTIASD